MMKTRPDEHSPIGPPSIRDHLANERTLLAWIRTAVTITGLGFLIDRIALPDASPGWQTLTGIVLVLFGGLVAVAGAYSYLNARRELATGAFRPAVALHLSVVALVIVGSLAVAAFLLIDRSRS